MIHVKKCNASSELGLEKAFITFEIEDTNEDIYNYNFSLYRSTFEEGEYELILSNIQNFECFDYGVDLYRHDIRYFYKIIVEEIATGKKAEGEVFTLDGAEEDIYAFYMSQLYNVYLDNCIQNSKLLLLKKKRSGTRCKCYDDIRGTSRQSKCTECYGTTIEGGYFNPTEISCSYFNSAAENEIFSPSIITDDETPIQLWTPNYPIIKTGDVLVDSRENKRYIVMSVQPSKKSGFLVRQTIQAQRIPKTNIIYKLEV